MNARAWLPGLDPRRSALSRLAIVAVSLSAMALTACSNPFLVHYQGERCVPVPTAQVATQQPVDAVLLGQSDFVTDVAVGDVAAIAAAQRVGANIVQWDRAFLRQEVVLQSEALRSEDVSARPVPTEVPVTESGSWYRIHARFWRSSALGGLPPVPAAVPAPEPAPTTPPEDPPSTGIDS